MTDRRIARRRRCRISTKTSRSRSVTHGGSRKLRAGWLVVLALMAAEARAEREDASGDWGGARSWLDDNGLHIDIDYTAETFARAAGGKGERIVYRGNLDGILTFDTEKLGLWPGGTLLVYGQHAHGEGISPAIGVVMLVSNLEAPEFTQLSELWYEQRLFDDHLRFIIGKQDANRELAGPRFAGNWVNSSFGVIPSVPMPSFPAPGLGALVAVAPARWLELRAAALEAAPEIGSIGLDTAFRGDGAFLAATIAARHDIDAFSGGYTLGGWQRTGPESARGLLAVVDTHILVAPDIDRRSVQLFVRFGWSPDKPGGVGLHTGGGVTLHGLLGRSNDTLGLGGGVADVPDGIEAFLELFYKLRLAPWLTFEPEAQLFLHPGGAGDPALIIGLRGKIKL